ncbi:hypothetical protein [Thermococcus gorgonarius]|uniref:hypothetical protein n=1 Tax=Thermococcus gorgonarius TaxID=71997 RepID=UPI001E5A28D9|nr:hypothetical protein [Thermococcus gorgonarius]
MRKMDIDFFDEQVVEGGFPEGALVLVAGEPGSGKLSSPLRGSTTVPKNLVRRAFTYRSPRPGRTSSRR